MRPRFQPHTGSRNVESVLSVLKAEIPELENDADLDVRLREIRETLAGAIER